MAAAEQRPRQRLLRLMLLLMLLTLPAGVRSDEAASRGVGGDDLDSGGGLGLDLGFGLGRGSEPSSRADAAPSPAYTLGQRHAVVLFRGGAPEAAEAAVAALARLRRTFAPELQRGALELHEVDGDGDGDAGEAPAFAHYGRIEEDLTCLVSAPLPRRARAKAYAPPAAEADPSSDAGFAALVAWVNWSCGFFRTPAGGLTSAGEVLAPGAAAPLYRRSAAADGGVLADVAAGEMTAGAFFREHLVPQRPVLLRGAVSAEALAAVRDRSLWEKLAREGREVHVKVGAAGEFEGVEPVERWLAAGARGDGSELPPQIAAKLQSPELAVVRPAHVAMSVTEFLGHVDRAGATNSTTAAGEDALSLYVEYFSIPEHLPELRGVVHPPAIADDVGLRLAHENLWWGIGDTVGHMHFDAFDNLLCPLVGTKTLTMVDATNNTRLYEGHIREAMLSLDAASRLQRAELAASTSMVNTPVDVRAPDLARFPAFRGALDDLVTATVPPGDCLYVPAFWWHHVETAADAARGTSLAVNYWYEPLYRKNFPCAACAHSFNHEAYGDAIEGLARLPA